MTAPARFDADHPASARQRRASEPFASTWLSANAGSGKTRVLTDRVARLLLGGVDPQTVLCLTYTKAAAAEMQLRLFRTLGQWSMMPEAELRAALAALGLSDALESADLGRARTLFAQAIETPGGLKIQTIHAFCASLLRRFPREAGVSPDFRELDDREARRLRAEVAEAMATGPLAPLVDAVAAHAPGDWDGFLGELASARDAFAGAFAEEEIKAHLGLPPEACEEWLVGRLLDVERRALLAGLREAARVGKGKGDAELIAALAPHCGDGPWHLGHVEVLEELFLYKSDDKKGAYKAGDPKRGKIGTKEVRDRHPDLMDDLDAFMEEVSHARDSRLALRSFDKARALHGFAGAFAAAFEEGKVARGALDFDDLISRAHALLTDPSVAQWVLWRLDGGLDHILVDEAQDTSPAQWAVIERLASEFAAGQGAERRSRLPRTIFVVGDRKQSIYSFQGADAAGFERMRAHFAAELGRIDVPLAEESLEWSFRSAETILNVVDAVFGSAHEGLGEAPRHQAFKATMPGRVDLWPPVPRAEATEEEGTWHEPVDRVGRADERLVLAQNVAKAVKAMIEHETLPVAVEDGWGRRPVTPGDILILVRKRSGPLFSGLIRALKSAGVEVAGADRLRLRAELAVRDVEAVLRVLALPDDDLSLAAALKSPLFGWTEAQLYDLAQPRAPGQTLWDALDRAPECPAQATLRDLRGVADYLRPYELAQRLLIRHEGRKRLLARLGPEAEDGLDAFLAQCLLYERDAVPSLTGFLEWRATAEVEVKRQLDAGGDRVRVMTVHGAKGLESPIVILPDCAVPGGVPRQPTLVPMAPLQGGARKMLWRAAKAEAPRALREAQAERTEAERREAQRLLYVAMTRAESWLIVAAAGETGGPGQSWHADVAAGLEVVKAAEQAFPWCEGGEGRRAGGSWDHLPTAGAPRPAAPPEASAVDPGPVPPPPAREKPLAPSGLGGAETLGGEPDPSAAARGTLLHLALEHVGTLGAEGTLDLLLAAEAAVESGLSIPELAALADEAETLLAEPALQPLLGPQPPGVAVLTEAAVAGRIEGLGALRGQVDRLLVAPDRVTLVDFKSHAAVPEAPEAVPEAILRQMGAYIALLEPAWPGREVVVEIVWTRSRTRMALPRALCMAALTRAAVERTPPRLDAP